MALGVAVWTAQASHAGVAEFTRPTDTILVPGHIFVSQTITMEAELRFSPAGTGGDIFHEQYWGATDKCLQAGRVTGGALLDGTVWAPPEGDFYGIFPDFDFNAWHHFAYVRDSTTCKLYLDGALIKVGSSSGAAIGNSAQSWMSVGAFQYTFLDGLPGWHPAFCGTLDWLRVSSNARYTGDQYVVPGEPAPDESTLLLYNFNDAPGSSVVEDLSSNHWNGQLGVGHFQTWATPTAPTLVPEPATLSLLALGGLGLLRRRK